MLFNSVDFLLFLPLFFCLILVNSVAKDSVAECADFGRFLPVLWLVGLALLVPDRFFSTLVDYFCGLQLARKPGEKRFLYLSLLVNLGILSAFKYFNFFLDSWYDLAANLGFSSVNNWAIDVVLPVGISFYTFQTLSYTIDVYRKKNSC